MEFWIGNVWLLMCAALVFIMHLGFACLETGLTQSKNSANILFKNVFIICIGLVAYAFVGFNLMYPGDGSLYFGFSGFGLSLPDNGATSGYNANYTYYTDFIFQAMFAATAATIVSGAVAERMKLTSFLIFAVLFVGLCYPVIGMWKWGGGWLDQLGFYDFAGSTLVHMVGGWGALAGALLLGRRLRQKSDLNPHSLPLATIGTFLLWLGWFGFNGGSVLSADPGKISLVITTTFLAAAAGGIGSMISQMVIMKRFDLAMSLNGILGGLVGITAGADLMSPNEAMLIGLIAGCIVVPSVLLLNKYIDDPVGAVSVHLVCGIWGTEAVGLFGEKAGLDQYLYQTAGIAASFTAFVFAFALLFVLKKMIGIRVSREEEVLGLDKTEHNVSAYRGIS